MHIYTLHIFDKNLAAFAYTLFLLIFLLVVLVEAIIIFLMKYNMFKKAFTDSLLANLVSVMAGIIIILAFFTEKLSSYGLKDIVPLFVVALVGESIVLWFLNPSKPTLKSVTVSAIMNFVTFLVLYLFIPLFFKAEN